MAAQSAATLREETMTPRPSRIGPGSLCLIWASGLCLGLLLTPGFNLTFETPPFESLEAFARTGRLGLEAAPARIAIYKKGLDGLYYPTHDFGTYLVGMPFAKLAWLASQATGLPFLRLYELVMGFVSAGLFGVTLAALLRAAQYDSDVDPARALLLLGLLSSSQYLVYAGYPADVSMSAAAFTLVYLAWKAAGRGSWAGAFLFGLGSVTLALFKVSNLTVTVVALGLALMGLGPLETRSRRLAVLAGALPVLILLGWWNEIRVGSPFATPYPTESTAWRIELLPLGLLGSLVSPGKGLISLTPALLFLPFALRRLLPQRARRRDVVLVVGSFLAALLYIAATVPWSGRGGWGIRYYTPWVPVMILLLAQGEWWVPAGSATRMWARRVLLSAGLVINLAGCVTNFPYRQVECGFEAWTLRGNNVCGVTALPGNLLRAAGFPIAERVVAGQSRENVFVSNRLGFWWYAVRTQGVPPFASWALGAGLLALAALAWRAAMRGLAKPSSLGAAR